MVIEEGSATKLNLKTRKLARLNQSRIVRHLPNKNYYAPSFLPSFSLVIGKALFEISAREFFVSFLNLIDPPPLPPPWKQGGGGSISSTGVVGVKPDGPPRMEFH